MAFVMRLDAGMKTYFRTVNKTEDLANIKRYIRKFMEHNNKFNHTNRRRRDLSEGIKEAILITYESQQMLCQVIIAANETATYIILNYRRAHELVYAYYSDFDPLCPNIELLSGINATHSSNIGVPGMFVFNLNMYNCKKSSERIGKEEFLATIGVFFGQNNSFKLSIYCLFFYKHLINFPHIE